VFVKIYGNLQERTILDSNSLPLLPCPGVSWAHTGVIKRKGPKAPGVLKRGEGKEGKRKERGRGEVLVAVNSQVLRDKASLRAFCMRKKLKELDLSTRDDTARTTSIPNDSRQPIHFVLHSTESSGSLAACVRAIEP